MPNLERTRLDRVRRTVCDYPNTTTLVAVMIALIVTAIAIPDDVAIWIYRVLLGVLVGWAIFCLIQLEKVSRS